MDPPRAWPSSMRSVMAAEARDGTSCMLAGLTCCGGWDAPLRPTTPTEPRSPSARHPPNGTSWPDASPNWRLTPAPTSADAALDALYTGKKAGLRPLHDQLMMVIEAFGPDVSTVPKKGYLSIRRTKQFAMIQPSAAGRLDV